MHICWHGIGAITVHSACFNPPLAKNLFGLYQSWISDVQLHMYLNTHGMHLIWHMTHVPQSQLKNQITQSKSADWGPSTHRAGITQWVRAWRLPPPLPWAAATCCSLIVLRSQNTYPILHGLAPSFQTLFFGARENRLLMVFYICSENTSSLLCGLEEHLSNIWEYLSYSL